MDAPDEIRGEFSPISTKVPGIQFSSHMTRLAAIAAQDAPRHAGQEDALLLDVVRGALMVALYGAAPGTTLSLPLSGGMSDASAERVIEALHDVLR